MIYKIAVISYVILYVAATRAIWRRSGDGYSIKRRAQNLPSLPYQHSIQNYTLVPSYYT